MAQHSPLDFFVDLVPAVPTLDPEAAGWIGDGQDGVPLEKGQAHGGIQAQANPFALRVEAIQVEEQDDPVVGWRRSFHQGGHPYQ